MRHPDFLRLNRFASLAFPILAGCSPAVGRLDGAARPPSAHVLLLSIDGLHERDLARLLAAAPDSQLARLAQRGTVFTGARSSLPSDSFPGLTALVTGGSPRTTGIYFDDFYDRRLSPAGGDCRTVGAALVFDEAADRDATALDAGGGLDPAKLPRDPTRGCAPVYPHQVLRVNTVFEVVKAAGRRTAWSDKHPAYDLVQGPSGRGVDDLYTPEIAAAGSGVAATEAYDDTKVEALLHQMAGEDHAGLGAASVPALYGMNFQAVSVAQKAEGYVDAAATPGAQLTEALRHVDGSLGRLLAGLEAQGLAGTTAVILTAKHGNAPIDPSDRKLITKETLRAAVGEPLAHATLDDVGLLWLADPTHAAAVAARLTARAAELGLRHVYAGAGLAALLGDPRVDSRAPDLLLETETGVIYADAGARKVAEHGGLGEDDTHVALLVAAPGAAPGTVGAPVSTRQVAPTILRLLGLQPSSLDAVRAENTPVLPGF